MATGIWVMIATAGSIAGFGWGARDIVITRPEVIELHNGQEAEIQELVAAADYFTNAQISNLQRQKRALENEIGQKRPTVKQRNDLKDMDREIEALKKRRERK